MEMEVSVNFKEELTRRTAEAEEIIEAFLPKEVGFTTKLAQAMNYSMLAGGKRLRPVFMKAMYEMFDGTEEVIQPFMAGMEMIHTHSLIHDDLPAIDNDDYRRGRKTTHIVFGEDFGVLSGDALLNYAYEVMLTAFEKTEHTDRVIRALKIMAGKTGIRGMLGGQSVDVENDGRQLDLGLLLYIYENKTSALIEAAMMTGAILAGASAQELDIVEEAASNIGIAFQIQDDILDITSTKEVLGKPIGSDQKNNKTTFVTLRGMEAAEETVEQLSRQAIKLLHGLNRESRFAEELILHLIHRKK